MLNLISDKSRAERGPLVRMIYGGGERSGVNAQSSLGALTGMCICIYINYIHPEPRIEDYRSELGKGAGPL